MNSSNAATVDPRHTPVKAAVALLLTFAAGYVDIIGYLTLYQTFTAHMTGTTVHLAEQLVNGNWNAVLIAASVIIAFVVGSVGGRIAIEAGARARVRSVAVVTLATEAMLIALFIPVATRATSDAAAGLESAAVTSVLLATLACAMGLQTATLTRIGPLTVHTTFVTGMLNKLAQMIAQTLFHTYDRLRSSGADREAHRAMQHDKFSKGVFLFSIWLMYLVGAASGTVMQRALALYALCVPVAIIGCAAIIDLIYPLSVEEEQDQSER